MAISCKISSLLFLSLAPIVGAFVPSIATVATTATAALLYKANIIKNERAFLHPQQRLLKIPTRLRRLKVLRFFSNIKSVKDDNVQIDIAISNDSNDSFMENNDVNNKQATFSLPRTSDIAGVIFDMDGTLIQPCIDFADMRNRIYSIADSDPTMKSLPLEKRRGDVLELYKSLSEMGKSEAKAVFDEIEAKAIEDMVLMEHVGELCHFLDQEGIPRAVLTRNVQRSVEVMHQKLWDTHAVREFYPAVSRDTMSPFHDKEPLPSKPSPDAIFHICNVWGCSPEQVIMVGDSAADDIVAAYRANCGGRVLLRYNGKELDNDAGSGMARTTQEQMEREPSLVIYNLRQLLEIFKERKE